jgi:hypothetical protein
VSEESLDVRWWDAAALPAPEPDLVDLVRLARHRTRTHPPRAVAPNGY